MWKRKKNLGFVNIFFNCRINYSHLEYLTFRHPNLSNIMINIVLRISITGKYRISITNFSNISENLNWGQVRELWNQVEYKILIFPVEVPLQHLLVIHFVNCEISLSNNSIIEKFWKLISVMRLRLISTWYPIFRRKIRKDSIFFHLQSQLKQSTTTQKNLIFDFHKQIYDFSVILISHEYRCHRIQMREKDETVETSFWMLSWTFFFQSRFHVNLVAACVLSYSTILCTQKKFWQRKRKRKREYKLVGEIESKEGELPVKISCTLWTQ